MISVNYGAFLAYLVNAPSATCCRTLPPTVLPRSNPVTTKRMSLLAALALALPIAALASTPSMAAPHKKPAHVAHRAAHKASTHHTITHRKAKPKTAHVAAH